MTDKTITITDYPEGTRRERVLALANGAKHALFGGGCSPLPDATLLRAALALDRLRDPPLPEVAVASIASMFTPGNDPEQSEETRALLAERLCDPDLALEAAVNQNRRLLGMPVADADDSSAGDGWRSTDAGALLDRLVVAGVVTESDLDSLAERIEAAK